MRECVYNSVIFYLNTDYNTANTRYGGKTLINSLKIER